MRALKEKIGIRILSQFLVMCVMRFILLKGVYADMTSYMIIIFLGYACLLTGLFESFDQLIVHLSSYRYIIMIVIIAIYIAVCVMCTWTWKVMLGYIFFIMIKDLWKLSSMQIGIEEFQKNYHD